MRVVLCYGWQMTISTARYVAHPAPRVQLASNLRTRLRLFVMLRGFTCPAPSSDGYSYRHTSMIVIDYP